MAFQVANSNLEGIGEPKVEHVEESGYVISIRRAMTLDEEKSLPRRGPDPNALPPDPALLRAMDRMSEMSDKEKAIIPATQEDLDKMDGLR